MSTKLHFHLFPKIHINIKIIVLVSSRPSYDQTLKQHRNILTASISSKLCIYCLTIWQSIKTKTTKQGLSSILNNSNEIAVVKLSPLLVKERRNEAGEGLGLHVPLLPQLIQLVPKHQPLVPAQGPKTLSRRTKKTTTRGASRGRIREPRLTASGRRWRAPRGRCIACRGS